MDVDSNDLTFDSSEMDGAVIENMDLITTTDILNAIPSESSIKAAKEKRERMRKVKGSGSGGGEEEFISLSVARRDENIDLGPHPESRLMREDDEMGDAEEGASPPSPLTKQQPLTNLLCRDGRVYWCTRARCLE